VVTHKPINSPPLNPRQPAAAPTLATWPHPRKQGWLRSTCLAFDAAIGHFAKGVGVTDAVATR
jgi:hypothetical protein